MGIRIVKEAISRKELQEIANERFGDLIKAVVDIDRELLALGAEMHADAQTLLMEKEGSTHEHTWGINLLPAQSGDAFIEFDSLINLKPAFGNRSRNVEDESIRTRIRRIVEKFVTE